MADVFNPSDHTVPEVTTYLDENPAAAAQVVAQESAGNARKGIVTHRVPEAAPSGVVDGTYNADDWVSVVLNGDKSMAPGQMPRAYFDGWGKDLGWTEVK